MRLTSSEYVDLINNLLNKYNVDNPSYKTRLDQYSKEDNTNELSILYKQLMNYITTKGLNPLSENLKNIIKEELSNAITEKKKADRCKRIADRKFDKPSSYKSGAIVRCRKGKIWKKEK